MTSALRLRWRCIALASALASALALALHCVGHWIAFWISVGDCIAFWFRVGVGRDCMDRIVQSAFGIVIASWVAIGIGVLLWIVCVCVSLSLSLPMLGYATTIDRSNDILLFSFFLKNTFSLSSLVPLTLWILAEAADCFGIVEGS